MKKFFVGGVIIAATLIAPVVRAVTIPISATLPNTTDSSTAGPAGFIANFYKFALLISGVLAFGAVVYGGIKYMVSAGNASAQSEGKDWIQSALIGILLLAGAYLILYTINPAIVNFTGLPSSLTPITSQNQTP